MTSRVEEDPERLSIDAPPINHLVNQSSGKLVKLTISNQPQPEVNLFQAKSPTIYFAPFVALVRAHVFFSRLHIPALVTLDVKEQQHFLLTVTLNMFSKW